MRLFKPLFHITKQCWNFQDFFKMVSNTFPMCRICCLTFGDRLRLRAVFKVPELCLSLLRDIPPSLSRTPPSLLPLLRLLSSRERKCWNIQKTGKIIVFQYWKSMFVIAELSFLTHRNGLCYLLHGHRVERKGLTTCQLRVLPFQRCKVLPFLKRN